MSLVPASDNSSGVSNNFPTCHKPHDPAAAGEGCSVPLPCQGCYSSALFALMTSEAEEASQGFGSVHGCHISFCLIHIKAIHLTNAFSYAICWFLLYNSTFWDPKCRRISYQGTENFTGCVCVQLGFFYWLAFKIIITYYLCLWLYEYAVTIFIICSFSSGPHVNFVGLHIEGDIIHACRSMVCESVCMQAAYCIHLFMCVQHVPVQRWANAVVCSAHSTSLSACQYFSAPWWFNHVLSKVVSTASQWRIFILGFHFQKLFQNDVPPLWRGKN